MSHVPSRTSRTSLLALFFTIIMLMAASLIACGGGGNTATTTQASTVAFAFVTNSGAGSVTTLAVNSNGGLSAVGAPVQAGAGAEFLAVDRVHKILFVSNQGANSVSAFAVDTSTGGLTAISGSPFTVGTRPTAIAVDPAGKFVFVANQADSSISVLNIGAGGSLSAVAGSPFAASSPFGLAVNPAGTQLFATNFPDSMLSDINTVSSFQIGANGALSPVTGSPFPTANSAGFASSLGLATDSSGKFLFVGDHMAQAVVPFAIGSTGALSATSGLPTPPPSCSAACHNNPLRLAVHPSDRFVYATNVQAGTVTTFSVNNGVLTAMGDTATGQHPFGVAFDPSGNFVFVVNKMDSTVSAYAVNASTGGLKAVSGSPFAAGLNAPTDIVVVGK